MPTKRKGAKHSEVLSGATFHKAATERGAKTQAQVYKGSGHRVKVAQHNKKWGCWVWPKHRNKRNPASGAVAMREAFTGLPSKKDMVVSESVHVHSHLAALGELIELKVKTVKGETVVIGFEQHKQNPKKDVLSKVGSKTKGWAARRAKALTGTVKYLYDYWINPRKLNPNGPVLLCSNEKGTHLYIEGGDQSLELGKLGLSEMRNKESLIIGSVKTITYHARKKFDGKEEEYDYVHKFSEDSDGPLPMLRYDVRNKHLYLDGGVYHIPRPTDSDSASQGITD